MNHPNQIMFPFCENIYVWSTYDYFWSLKCKSWMVISFCFQRNIRQTGAQLNSSSDASKQSVVPTEADVVIIGGGRFVQFSYLHLLTMMFTVLAARRSTTWPKWGSLILFCWRKISSQLVRNITLINTGFLLQLSFTSLKTIAIEKYGLQCQNSI